jgi:DNA-binding FadR family transcriptional regulator
MRSEELQTERAPRRARLSDEIVEDFVTEIVSGRLEVGAVLPAEPELVTRYGVSKVVVRDSLLTLASLGLIHVQQGKRTVVLDESEWDVLSPRVQSALRGDGRGPAIMRQMFEARLVVEPAAAELSARRATAEEKRAMSELVARMAAIAAESQDTVEFLHVDRAFHDLVARSARNLALRAMMRDLHVHTAAFWSKSQINPADLGELVREHRRIADAIAHGASQRARAAMADHIKRAGSLEAERLEQSTGGLASRIAAPPHQQASPAGRRR